MLFAPVRPKLGFVDRWADYADGIALIGDSETLTYAELGERVAATQARLGTGRRLVLIATKNSVSTVVTYLAALRAGHVVLLVPGDRPADALIERYDPDVVVGPGRGAGVRIKARRAGSRHDLHADLAVLLSTSGSTGSPKLVRLSYENLDSNAEAIAEYLGIRPSDRAMTSLPLAYCYGLSVVHSHLARGAALVVTDLSVVDRCFWELARRAEASTFAGVPYTFDLLERAGFAEMDLPSLRYVTQAGGALGPQRVKHFAELGRRRGWDLVVMYGQTEATARMAYLPADLAAEHPGAIGVPIPGGAFDIDEDGELVFSGPNVMLGYADSPADLALGRTVERLHTGDLARRREDGLYEIVGRRSRFLKLYGLRLDLDQVQRVLAEEGIDALCTGDDESLVVAVTAPVPGLAETVRRRFGVPAAAVRTVDVEQFPRLSNGKPDYQAVRQAASAADAAAPRGVRDLYRDLLVKDDVADDATFVSLGGDSLSFVEVSLRLEEMLGHLPPDWHLMTVADLQSSATPRGRWRIRWVETNVVLRAVAIVLVVAQHVDLVNIMGGSHILLAVAGFSFARFPLTALRKSGRVRPMLGTVARIAVPSVLVIAAAALITGDYNLWNVLLLNHYVGPDEWGSHWDYWFIEAIVEILLVAALLFTVPAVRRWERARPFALALAVLAVCLALRFHVFLDWMPMEPARPHTAAWCFAFGWAVARANRTRDRLLLTAVILVAVPGYFTNELRGYVLMGGLAALLWVARVPLVAPLHRLVAILAAASLWIYLLHWQVFGMMLDAGLPPSVVTAAAIGVGVAAWAAVPAVRIVARNLTPRCATTCARSTARR